MDENLIRIEEDSEAYDGLVDATGKGRDVSLILNPTESWVKIKVGEGVWSPALSAERK